jgi:hypothetical protein
MFLPRAVGALSPSNPRQMMRLAILALALMVLAAPLATSAQQPVDAPRIGYLDSGSPPGIPPVTAFQEGLRELGYIEGQNITSTVGRTGGTSSFPTFRLISSGSM